MSNQSVDANQVIENLIQQIAELSKEKAIASALAEQLQRQLNEAHDNTTQSE